MVNQEFVRKMAQAKRMERDALLSLIPESRQEHAANISREMRAMLCDELLERKDGIFEIVQLLRECCDILGGPASSATKDKSCCTESPSSTDTNDAGEQKAKTQKTGKTRKVDIL